MKKPQSKFVPKQIIWYRKSYPSDTRYGSVFQKTPDVSLEEKQYPYAYDNRIKRQKLQFEPSEEQSTIREIWDDDEEETGIFIFLNHYIVKQKYCINMYRRYIILIIVLKVHVLL